MPTHQIIQADETVLWANGNRDQPAHAHDDPAPTDPPRVHPFRQGGHAQCECHGGVEGDLQHEAVVADVVDRGDAPGVDTVVGGVQRGCSGREADGEGAGDEGDPEGGEGLGGEPAHRRTT